MPLKHVHYQRLETEDSEGEEDESPPTHVELHNSHYVKGNRWNHIENLDDFFERVYLYHRQHGLAAIVLSDIFELIQFAFMVTFATFLIACLKFENLFTDKITFVVVNGTEERDVVFGDLFDLNGLNHIPPLVVLILVMAVVFWVVRLLKACWRFFKFWETRTFYTEALNIPPSDLRDCTWAYILSQLKEAQREYKMNIRKQELSELDVYHRILRFKNYMVAMVNKSILPCKFWIPFYGEKVFFTHGLQFNYELLLFWGPGAPFRKRFYLSEDYKSASKKHQLVQSLQLRISVLALLNLIFSPVIFLYQILYSFFTYTEFLKRRPGMFGRRRWSLYGGWFLRDFNELDHELLLRLNRAYRPSVKYMDLFVHPIVTIVARNIAFIAGSLLAVLLVLTVIQEDLLTAHNVLTFITILGLIVTACRIVIPDENQVWCPAQLMQEILGEVHYMPDHWKEKPHSVDVYIEFTQVLQSTLMHLIDELLSPLVTPFILYFSLRHKASDIVDFLRSFTIEVSGVGDVCSFAEMNVKKHGHPEWLSLGMTRATQYEQAELGKTEISLMHFSRKNPNWKPSEEGTTFMTQLRESVEELHQSQTGSQGQQDHHHQHPEESLAYLTLHPTSLDYSPPVVPSSRQAALRVPASSHPGDSMLWSIWSVRPGYSLALQRGMLPPSHSDPVVTSTVDTLNLHQLHDQMKAQQSSPSPPPQTATAKPVTLYSSQASIEAAWTIAPSDTTAPGGLQSRATELSEPLLPVEESHEGRGSATAREQSQDVVVQIHDDSGQQ